MENPIIENVLPKNWESELNKLDAKIAKIAENVERINISFGKGGDKDVAKNLANETKLLGEEIKKSADYKNKLANATVKLTREEKLQQTISNSLKGSYNQMQAQLSLNLIKLKALSEEERKNAEIGGKLIAQNLKLNQSLKAIDKAMDMNQRNVGNYSSALDGIKGFIDTLAAGAVAAGMAIISSALAGTTETALEAEKAMQRLSFAVKNVGNGDSSQLGELTKTAERLMGIFDDEEIKDAAVQMLNFGLTSKQVNQLLPLMVDAAAASGKSLSEMAMAIDKGIDSGVMARSALGQLGLAFKDTGNNTENYSIILRGLTKFTGGNVEAMKSQWGQIENAKVQWGEVREQLGGVLLKAVIPLANGVAHLGDIWLSTQQKITNSTDRISQGRLESFKSELVGEKDKIKYINDEMEAERGVYRSKQARINQINEQISQNNRLGGSWVKQNKNLEKEKIGLQTSVNWSIAYVNALAGLRQEIKGGVGDIKLFSDGMDQGSKSTEKEAEAFNMLALQMEPAINKAKELANSDKLSFEEREKAVTSWFNLRYSVAIEDEKVQNEKLDKEYKKALKNTKDKKSLDEWYAQEKEKISLSSSNAYIAIMDEAENMIEAINKDESKSEQEKADEIAKVRKDAHKTRLEQIQDEIDKWNKIRKKEIEDEKKINEEKRKLRWDLAKYSVDIIAQLGDSLLQVQLNQLDEQNEAYKKSYDERIAQIEGLGLSEEETTKEKAAAEAYYQSQLEQTKQREKELQREQFLLNQLAALAQVAINTAINITSPENIAGALTPYYIAIGAAQAAVIAAQTIPAFAEGGKITDSPNIPTRPNGDNILAYVSRGETILNNDQVMALGGAWAMKQAGVPGYEDARYQPDMTDIRAGYNGKTGKIIVNANFESEKIVRKLDELIRVSKSEPNKLMDTLKMQRYAKR